MTDQLWLPGCAPPPAVVQYLCWHYRVGVDRVHRGPMLHNEVWATIAKPTDFLCFACVEERLGRRLTQRDLTICPLNAGWQPFDATDHDSARIAIGRKPLPP